MSESEVPEMKGLRTIFTPDPGEIIVAQTVFRDHLYIATDRRLLEYSGEEDTLKVLKFAVVGDSLVGAWPFNRHHG